MPFARPMKNRVICFGLLAALALAAVSGAAAQQATPSPIPTETPTITPTPVPVVPITLFRDSDSLAVFVGEPVNLSGLALQAVTLTGEVITRRLEDYASLRGLPFGQLPTPICFRLVRAGSAVPVVSACQIPLLLSQPLANADIFWHDSVSQTGRLISVLLDEDVIGLCPPTSEQCPVDVPLRESTPTPTPSTTPDETATPTLTPTPARADSACEGVIMFSSGGLLNQVKVSPFRNAPFARAVQQGSTVVIQERRASEGIMWYQIRYANGGSTGWIPAQYVTLLNECPA
jgi:hypothetical protein